MIPSPHMAPPRDGPPHLVIFDFDGVLIDSEAIALTELAGLMTDLGVAIDVAEARDRFLGATIGTAADWAAARGAGLTGDAFAEAWYARLFVRYETELRPMPGAEKLLATLCAAGIPFCIATGGSVRRLAFALRLTGLDRFFPEGHAHSADAVARGKPAPDLFLHAAARHGVAPGQCLVIEDAPAGVIGATAAGMVVEGFVGGSHLAERRDAHGLRLADCGARALHDDLSALGRHLAGLAAGTGQSRP